MRPQPSLFARTARAGRHHQVDLVPPGMSIPSGFDRCSRCAEAGTRVGADYLAVCWDVLQDNGRPGKEVLVLHGVDVCRLKPRQREAVLTELQQLKDELERQVTKEIDWNKHGPAAVECPELGRWLERLQQAAGGSLPAARRRLRPLKIVLVLVAVLLLLAGGVVLATISASSPPAKDRPEREPGSFLGNPFKWLTGKKEQKKPKNGTGKGAVPDSAPDSREQEEKKRRELATLSEKWKNGISPEQVQQVLEEARRRTEAATGSALPIEQMRSQLVTRWQNSTKTADRLKYVIPGLQEKDNKAVLELLKKDSTKADALKLREKLDDFAKTGQLVLGDAPRAKNLQPSKLETTRPRCEKLIALLELLQGNEYTNVLVEVKNQEGLAASFAKTPLLDGRHARLARLVVQLRGHAFPELAEAARRADNWPLAIEEAVDSLAEANQQNLDELKAALLKLEDCLSRSFPPSLLIPRDTAR